MTEDEEADEIIEILRDPFYRYRELLPIEWKDAAKDIKWWNNMCSDFPPIDEFDRRLNIARFY